MVKPEFLFICRINVPKFANNIGIIITREERGIEKGIIIAAENMIKDGDTNDKIKRCAGLDESVITELRKLIEANSPLF